MKYELSVTLVDTRRQPLQHSCVRCQTLFNYTKCRTNYTTFPDTCVHTSPPCSACTAHTSYHPQVNSTKHNDVQCNRGAHDYSNITKVMPIQLQFQRTTAVYTHRCTHPCIAGVAIHPSRRVLLSDAPLPWANACTWYTNHDIA
jgi:hypothetical protein